MDIPAALQLRYSQTLKSISAENNSTIVYPVPLDIMSSVMQINNYNHQQQQQFQQFQNFQEHQKFSQFPQPSFPLNGQQLPGVKPLAVHTPTNKCQMSFLWVGIKTSNLYGLFK